jgi:hypothetical protein
MMRRNKTRTSSWARAGLFLLAFVMTIAPQRLLAQPDTLWTRTFGGDLNERGNSVVHTTDGGYIIGGYTASYGLGSTDVWLIKTDANGEPLGARTYGDTAYDRGQAVVETSDGGYVVVGYTTSYGAGGTDVYAIRTDSQGDALWTRTYGGAGSDEGYGIAETSDGGFVIAGSTQSYGSGDYDVYLVRVDSDGNMLWKKTFGGEESDRGRAVILTANGGFLVAGSNESETPGTSDFYLIRTDPNGNQVWMRTYGGSDSDEAYSVIQTTDSGYLAVGSTRSYGAEGINIYLIKTNPSGDTVWTKTYGGSEIDEARSVVRTDDGGYCIAGYTMSYGASASDVYLLKIDSHGDSLWAMMIGGDEYDEAFSIDQSSDGSLIVTGYTLSYGAGGNDVYLIRVASEVGIEEDGKPEISRSSTKIWPNPSPVNVSVTYGIKREGTVNISLYDLAGRVVDQVYVGHKEAGEHRLMMDTRGLSSGIYFLHMDLPDRAHTERLIVIR